MVIPILTGILALTESCKTSNPVEPDLIIPDSGVSYSKHIEPIFQAYCALAGCHVGSDASSNLDLSPPSYFNLRNYLPPLVVSGEADNSLLVWYLDGRADPRMPLYRAPLSQNQIKGIKTWINEGAQNN